MKRIFFAGAFCAFVLSAVPVIVVPQNANLQEKTAAKELALHLKLATGKTISTVTENNAPANRLCSKKQSQFCKVRS